MSRSKPHPFMSSHFPDHSFIIPQQVAIMKDCRFIAVGNADDVVTPAILQQAYGIDVTVTHVEEVGRRICVPSATAAMGNEIQDQMNRCHISQGDSIPSVQTDRTDIE